MTDAAARDYTPGSIRESLKEAGLEVYGDKELEAPDAATVLLEAITGQPWKRAEEQTMESIDTETCECDSCPNPNECADTLPPSKPRKTRSDKGVPRRPKGPRAATVEKEAAKAKEKLEKQLAKELARNDDLNKKAEAIGLDIAESDQKIHDLQRALGLGDDPAVDEAAE